MLLQGDDLLDPSLVRAITQLGFTEATAVQEAVLPIALAGKDVMVSARTGSGKTAAFLLPMLHRFLASPSRDSGTRGLILVPTRELALQIDKAFLEFAAFTPIKCGIVIGGESLKHQIATIRRNPEVLVATPGRLVEHLGRGTLTLDDLEVLVLDEADRMLDMGFAEDMGIIANACNDARQNLLFSATLAHRAMDRISHILKDPERVVIDDHRSGHESIVQEKVLCDDNAHKQALVAALVAQEGATRVFVFCNTRVQCEALCTGLRANDVGAQYIHGEVSQSDRKQVLNRFRDGKIPVLVATDVAARGLDVPDVDLVINFTVAQSGDEHVHRVGRTGRAGKDGKAITLVAAAEWNLMASIERYLKLDVAFTAVPGLEASYRGPAKLKKSGKAAGIGKRKAGNKVGGKARNKARGRKEGADAKVKTVRPKRPTPQRRSEPAIGPWRGERDESAKADGSGESTRADKATSTPQAGRGYRIKPGEGTQRSGNRSFGTRSTGSRSEDTGRGGDQRQTGSSTPWRRGKDSAAKSSGAGENRGIRASNPGAGTKRSAAGGNSSDGSPTTPRPARRSPTDRSPTDRSPTTRQTGKPAAAGDRSGSRQGRSKKVVARDKARPAPADGSSPYKPRKRKVKPEPDEST